jgi:CHAT domain-containing protein
MPVAQRRISIAVVLAVLAVIGAATGVLALRTRDPIDVLVSLNQDSREIEPRLSGGFAWAPFANVTRKAHEAAFLDAVVSVRGRGRHDHATAIASIMAGDPRSAIATLEPLATPADARVFSDLSAAHYVIATRNGEPARFQQALVAADEALRIDPAFAEAQFNRALIIEALGLRDLARSEWERYLRIDPGSEWSTEARAHLRALAPQEKFENVMNREYERVAGDLAAARALARRYPERTRLWGEAEIFGNWAVATREQDEAAATKHLRLAHEMGSELARDGGDRTLLALAEAIESADPARQRALAEAHLHLRDGVRAYRDRRPKNARPLLVAAEEEFARQGSSGRFRAQYFVAASLFLEGNIAQTGRRMKQLLEASPPDFHGHRAETRWVLASVAVSEGRWGNALDAWTESLSIYERLGEKNNAAIVRQQLVFTYDRLGDRGLAWKLRMPALRELGRELNVRQYEAIVSVTRAAVIDGDWQTARSFVRLEVDIARHIDSPVLQAESLLYQTEIDTLLGERDAATTNLKEARQRIVHIPDPAFREVVGVRANVAEASLTADTATAVQLLTEAIEFHSTKGRRMYVPDLFLRRGRASLKAGDEARASADFEAGIAELERHRESVMRGENRWGVFHAAQELFGEAVALALSRDDAQTAFDYSERARARALFDTIGTPWRAVRAADVSAGTCVIEYAVHQDTVSIFVVDTVGVRAVRRPLPRTRLAAEITALMDSGAASDGAKFRKSARVLYEELIAPIERELTGRQTLVFVSDPALGRLPFAALIDSAGMYLVEKHAVTVAPSAAFFVSARKPRALDSGRTLIIGGTGDAWRLPAVEREVRAIAALHPKAVVLQREDATPWRFLAAAREAELIHFAGHAVSSTAAGDGYLELRGNAGSGGRLGLSEIASAKFPRASLVVLAACDTAAGEVRPGEGTISVARGFLAAGVPTVVATLWPIDDEASAELFPVLHRYLARGMPAREALRAAQIEWIRRGDRSIGLWAAIQLVGQ